MTTVARAISEFLALHGVELMVGQSLPSALHLAVPDTSIKQIQVRTENAGTALCDAYARKSGKIAVMTAQNGPAATLLVPGLAEALKASVPILAIVQEIEEDHVEKNAFQELDHHKLFWSCSKWVGRLTKPSRVYEILNLALVQAVSGRPGPSVLMMPPSVLVASAPKLPSRIVSRSTFPLDRNSACRSAVRAAAADLSKAENPLIVVGGGVHSSGAYSEVEQLHRKFGFPVATTLMGKGAVDETDPLSLGVVGFLLGKQARNIGVREYINQADLVFFIGARTNQNGTDSWKQFPQSARFIHLDVDPVEVGRNYESTRLVGDARETLVGLLEDLCKLESDTQIKNRKSRLANRIPRPREVLECIPGAVGSGVRPERIVHTLNKVVPPEAVITADASYSSAWLCAYGISTRAGQRFLTPRGLAGLGWGFPYMLGAKIADPTVPVLGICGDGGFSHGWSELETALRNELNVVVIVLKNGVLGYQRDAELVKFGAYTNAIPVGEIDHAGIARACGCIGVTIEEERDFEPALIEALNADKPVVLDVRTDASAFPPVTLLDPLVSESPGGEGGVI